MSVVGYELVGLEVPVVPAHLDRLGRDGHRLHVERRIEVLVLAKRRLPLGHHVLEQLHAEAGLVRRSQAQHVLRRRHCRHQIK